MFANKPIIGLTGGIGSGKTFVAALFGELGCAVISADAHVRDIYRRPEIQRTLRQWWGDGVLDAAGNINRIFIAQVVFNDAPERRRLEALIHPLVQEMRREQMETTIHENPQVIAFVWDTPLLVESGMHRQCDAVVLVEAPRALRLERVRAERGWDEAELDKREKLQLPLDKKRQISEYTVGNTADAGYSRSQVRAVLSRIVAGLPGRPP
jgi:dephospho-CoA kinase